MIKIIETIHLSEAVKMAFENNSIPQNNCAYCSSNIPSIHNDFEDLMLSPHLLIGYFEKEQLKAIMGFYFNSENGWTDCIGPFFKDSWKETIAIELFSYGKKFLKKSIRFNFYFNAQNQNCTNFMKSLNALQNDNEYIFTLQRDKYIEQPLHSDIIEYEDRYLNVFTELFERIYPEIYISAGEIISTISINRKVFLSVKEEELLGFGILYYTQNPDRLVAEIFGIDPHHRRKGYGRDLLNNTIQYAFSHFKANHIELVVDQLNEGAQNLYFSCNFELKTENRSFCIYPEESII